ELVGQTRGARIDRLFERVRRHESRARPQIVFARVANRAEQPRARIDDFSRLEKVREKYLVREPLRIALRNTEAIDGHPDEEPEVFLVNSAEIIGMLRDRLLL